MSSTQLEQSMQDIRQRYEDETVFLDDMMANGLDEKSLRTALFRELTFDGVMQVIGSTSAEITELDVRIFYEMHPQRFNTPETRKVSHILITVNDDYLENTREAALKRMQDISGKLNNRSNRFSQFAKQYSECPTAMEGGALGDLEQGHLYPELDEVLFLMEEGTISHPVETEMGFHILLCEKIKPSRKIPFNTVKERIHELLDQRQRRQCQKTWLASLDN